MIIAKPMQNRNHSSFARRLFATVRVAFFLKRLGSMRACCFLGLECEMHAELKMSGDISYPVDLARGKSCDSAEEKSGGYFGGRAAMLLAPLYDGAQRTNVY